MTERRKDGRAVVLGMARSGRSAARLLLSHGLQVLAMDTDPPEETLRSWDEFLRLGSIENLWGAHPMSALDRADLLVRSPGIPSDVPILEEARRRGIPIVSEVELAFERAQGIVVGVTGTNGKSTTTAWIAHILREAGRPAVACGNIGRPFGDAVLEEAPETCLVVEVSSFQLEDIRIFRPKVGVLLNITPDHLDRYPSLEAYAEAKWNLFRNQTAEDWAVIGTSLDPPFGLQSRQLRFNGTKKGDGVFEAVGQIVFEQAEQRVDILPASELALPGPHNRQNAMAAAAATIALGLSPSKVSAGLRSFRPLPHRMEPVGSRNDILWVNDSKATNLESMEVALRSYENDIVLIAGGRDKGADFGKLEPLVRRKLRHLIVLGEAAETIAGAWPLVPMTRVATLEEAVEVAGAVSLPGNVILLSPGCASQDMFRDYQERGDVFRKVVAESLGEESEGDVT